MVLEEAPDKVTLALRLFLQGQGFGETLIWGFCIYYLNI